MNNNNQAIKQNRAVVVYRNDHCEHKYLYNRDRNLVCDYCNLINSIYSFQVKNSAKLNRYIVENLLGINFTTFYSNSLNLNLCEPFYSDNASDSSDSESSSGPVSPVSTVLGSGSQVRGDHHSRNLCDHAEHLFECASSDDSTRGKLFPVCRESCSWYATCAKCATACEYATPRAQSLIAIFLHFCKIRVNGPKCFIAAKHSDDWRMISFGMLETILKVIGSSFSDLQIDGVFDEPIYKVAIPLVQYKKDVVDHFDLEPELRFATIVANEDKEDCEHDFYLINELSDVIPLSPQMMRLFMMFNQGFGYLAGRDKYDHVVSYACGVYSIGGLMGVNALCNEGFIDFHRNFYNGAVRQEVSLLNFYAMTHTNLCEVEITAESQSDLGSYYGRNTVTDDSEDEEEFAEEEVDLEAQYESFMNNDEALFEIETTPRVTGRGLKQRIGGLLRGVSNCVKKLHAVWDWPLDVAVNIVDKTGKYMEENKEYIDENVWSCTMCQQLNKDQLKAVDSQEKSLAMIREAVKRLAAAVDASSSNNVKVLEELESKLKDLDSKIRNMSTGVDESLLEEKLDGKLKNFKTAIYQVLAEKSKENSKAFTVFAYDLSDLTKKVNELASGDKMPTLKKKRPSTSGIGEQLPIPKGKVTAQSDLKQTEVVNPETIASKEVIGSLVKASGANDVHSAIHARHLVMSFKWEVSSGEGDVLCDIVMPDAIFSMNDRMANIASYFQYFNCDGLEFEITTTSILLQGGTLFVCWDSMSCATKQKVDSVLQLSGLPGVYIHASKNELIKFKVESSSIQHLMCLSGSEDSVGILGTLKICCANVLNAPAEASQSVNVNVWVKFVNPQLSFYTVRHGLVYGQNDKMNSLEQQLQSLEAIVAKGVWKNDSDRNLCELVVHPTSCSISEGVVTQTPLSVVSHVFARWKGELTFRFIFGASAFVSGKLLVTAVPVQFRQSKLSLTEMTGFPSLIVDLSSQEREFEFTVPYHSIGKNSLVSRNSLYDVSSYDSTLVTTRLHVIILDSLVMNANASNSISYTVTMRPGKTFELLEPHGIHAEAINKNIAQYGFQESPSCGGIIGLGFSDLCGRESELRSFKLDSGLKNAMCFVVSPTYRSMPPCTTQISWLAQIFAEWRGEISYTLRAHSFDKTRASYVKIWYEPNGSTLSGEDFEFLSGINPPAGAKVRFWNMLEPISFRARFTARTEKLLIQKPRYEPTKSDWLKLFNGVFYVDYDGPGSVELQLYTKGGENFEMFERTVAPRCGKVSEAFTKLSYAKKLLDIAEKPKFERTVLRGPFTEAVVDPVSFKPIKGVEEIEKAPADSDKEEDMPTEPREGDIGEDDDGVPIVFRRGKWRYATTKQMDSCCLPLGSLSNAARQLQDRDTCQKVGDIVDFAHKLTKSEDKSASDVVEVLGLLLPILKGVSGEKGEMGSGLIDKLKDRVINLLKPLIEDTIPGVVKCAFENQEYVWATIVTLVGGAVLFWAAKSVKGFKKKFAVLCMIIWSPFLKNKIWDLGSWIKSKWVEQFNPEMPCRKHSIAGMTEGAKMAFESFSEWFQGSWTSIVQSLLSVLGVVASLVVWGSVPDGKKLGNFSQIFKEVGEKGKTISQILNGWSTINRVVKEWSAKFMEWILAGVKGNVPSADSALQAIVKFDIKAWVNEVRELSLLENKFSDFGSEVYLDRVRRLYDQSQIIQQKLIDGCKVDLQLSMILKECKDKCTELLNESYTFKGMKKPRVDPFHICLIGKPGVGKSTLTHILINDMMDHKQEPYVDRIYTRCCADAYWSNYHQEPVILYDDLGAIKSSLKLSDYAEIMGIKTNDPFSVPMAGVNEKGRHCTSKYIYSCTNVLHLDDSGDVVTKNAYYRRRNILVEVERDIDVPRCPEDPTKGLLFTVKGHRFTGAKQDGVEFSLKTDWDESFLADVDTTNWVFDKVDYQTFLLFANVYSDAYMASQEILLKSMTKSRMVDSEVDEDFWAESQGETKTITLGEVIKMFDNLKLKGKDIKSWYQGTKYLCPDRWNTKKVLKFEELLKTMCNCREKGECSIEMEILQLRDVACTLTRNSDTLPTQVKFGFSKVAENYPEMVLTDKPEIKFEQLNPAYLLSTMLSWARMGRERELCPYANAKLFAEDKLLLSLDDIDFDDRISFDTSFVLKGKHNAILWAEVGKFFPKIVEKFGFLALFDGDKYIVLFPDLIEGVPSDDKVESCWKMLLAKGLEVNMDVLFLMNPEQHFIVKQLLNKVEKWDLVKDNYNGLRENMQQAKEVFGLNGDYITYGLILVEQSLRRYVLNTKKTLKERKLKQFSDACQRYMVYEQSLVPNLSGFVRIGLAIAGGILCVGSIVSLCLGFKKIIDSMAKLFGGKKKSQEIQSECDVEEVVFEELAEHEMHAASGSDGIATSYARQGRIPARVRITESGHRQMSGAHASDGNVTEHIITKRRTPVMRLVKEGGFGVTYSDVESIPPTRKFQRKTARKEFINAEKHISGEFKGKPAVIFNMEKWQSRVKSFGTLGVQREVKVPAICVDSSSEPVCEFSVSQDDFATTGSVSKLLEKHMAASKIAVKQVVEDKKVGDVHKQIRVGATGFDRDPNMVELLQTHVSKMSCLIFNASRGVSCNVLRLKGSMILMPAHYADDMEAGEEYYFVSPNKVVRINLDFSRTALVSEHQDLMVWDLGNHVPPSNDFTKYIAKAADWANYKNGSGCLSMTRYDSKCIMQTVHSIESVERIKADVRVPSGTYEMFDTSHTILHGLRYRIHCMTGFCGAAILRADSTMIRKIVGMHVAGHTEKGVGYAELLVLENIQSAMDQLAVDVSRVLNGKNLDESPVVMCEKQSEFPDLGNLGIRGFVASCEIPVIPTKTTICKSLIHGLIGEIKTEPSILSTWDFRLKEKRRVWDPILDAVTKYGTEIVPFPEDEIKLVEEHLISVFKNCQNSLRKREVNSLEVGINGIDQTDYWSPIEMKTSSGWPYCKEKPSGAAGKSWMFEQVGEYESGRPKYEMTYPKLCQSYNQMLEESKSGIPPCVVTMECPKDERRKLSKIYGNPATRTFTILPPEVNILFRQYFGDFAAMVMSNRATSFCQVGINPETLEWSELMNSFLAKSPKGFAGDYAKFDGISPASIYHSIVNIVNEWYDDGEENANVRHSLLNSIVHRNGIAKDLLVQYSQGMPSGFAMTVIFNSFVNYYFMALAWMNLVSRSKFSPEAELGSFDRYCRIIVYGDDNVVAVDEDFLEIYNLRTVASYLSEFGVTYTDDAKNPIHLSEPFVDITSVTFLKRNFTRVGVRGGGSGCLWKACLDKVSIEERCNWIRDCDDPQEALNQNVEGALFEASIWGEDYYNDLDSRLKDAYDRAMLRYPSSSFPENQRRWWSSMTGGQPSQKDLNKLVKLSNQNQIDLNSKIKDVFLNKDKSLLTMLKEATPIREISLEV